MGNPTHPKFPPHEFACQCGNCNKGFEDMRSPLLTKLYALRDAYNRPIIVTSAIRCAAHNAAVSNAKNSAHLRGWAVDIKFRSMEEGYALVALITELGFRRFGIKYSQNIIHLDDDPGLPAGLIPY
jgi:uncharacterized protein YcbK (DUF882 family)